MPKVDKIAFKSLMEMSVTKRLKTMQDRKLGPALVQLLTPTQISEMFPKHYQKALPDISGFLKAVPSSVTAARQRDLERQLQETQPGGAGAVLRRNAGLGENEGGEFVGRFGRNSARVLGKGHRIPPDLTPEQSEVWNKLIRGEKISAEDAKFLKNIPDEKLASAGIEKVKDETGKESFKYAPPETGVEEATARLKTGGEDNKFFSSIIRSEGTGKYGDPYNTSLSYIKSPKPLTEMTMREVLEWGDHLRHNTDAGRKTNSSAKGAFQIVNTTQKNAMRALGIGMDEKFSPENQRRMAAWIATNQGLTAWEGLKAHPNEMSNAMDAMKDGLHRNIESKVVPAGKDGQYTKEQIEKVTEQINNEKNATRRQRLANELTRMQESTGEPTGSVQYGQTKDWSKFALSKGVDNYTHKCGIGARTLAGHMYGQQTFISEGLGGNAESLSRGNNYFQRSGLFKAGQNVTASRLSDQAYLDSLPIGTVISSTGGRRGQGHAQIKIGPNQWASDTVQSHLLTNGYGDFVVHAPNETGLAKLKENGVEQTIAESSTQSTVQAAPTKTSTTVKTSSVNPNYSPDIPEHVSDHNEQQKEEKNSDKAKKELEEKKKQEEDSRKRQQQQNQEEIDRNKKNVSKTAEVKSDNKPTEIKPKPEAPKTETATPKMVEATTQKAPNVQVAASGGNVQASDKITAYPISGLRGDNTIVVDEKQKPLFTMNSKKEAIMPTGESDRVNVIPNAREQTDTSRASTSPMSKNLNVIASPLSEGRNQNVMTTSDFNHTVEQLKDKFDNISGEIDRTRAKNIQPSLGATERDSNLISVLNEKTEKPFSNPSVFRAFSRTRFHETGDAMDNFHNSIGNKNIA